MNTIYFATGNKGKILEAQAILDIPLEIASLDLDEVQSMDIEYVARKKAEAAFAILGKPVIIDDVGVYIEAWDGLPGPFAKYFLDAWGNKKILELLKDESNRNVIVKSALGYHDGKNVHVFVGEVKGKLALEERGTEGFGFDPIVIPDGYTQTYAEMGLKGKNELSHRKKALDLFKNFLDSQEK